ncbi:MAG TPA: biopolymer transporter ExbD [Planctomycetota bacterium]|nr:biopolymer transporter ExbD [Planctomycetota bacterium]
MRLDFDEQEAEDEVPINLTPMLDMVFNLLLFFLAATTFAKEEVELDLRLPEARSGQQGTGPLQLIINVFANGRLSVEGREVTFEALRQKLEAACARNREQAVLIRGDRQAQFGVGLQVLDACRLAKIKKVDFAALPAQGQ